ncbi:hypothetical protein [Bacillus toyonensis]|uniref:hypothetical protein n=1 Tax=Bacillus toyonensis TaxID=155322 RepID=UPI000BF83498|nr:hypothetical protein [Bacillus toyonensis]PGE68227.1 hypothetical protein COM69_15190 [Bacillus toyonensis]PHD44994.1 hypothetical protein COF65_05915 [Bacillus toyonensis]PRT14073.1 hypothetical protein C6353_26710 [Bacillus toyonensis]
MKKLFSFLLFVFVIFSANNISFADEVIPFNKSFFAYNEPSFTSAKGNGGAQYGPQKALTVKEKRSDGWWKIGTWEGDKWINTDGEKKKIEKPYITFAEPKFTSPKGNNGNVIAPQVVTAIDGQEDGWLKIQTNEGDKWIFLNSEAVKVDKNFYAYNEPSFTSEKASGGNQYGPQKSLVVKEKRTNGWWKVATYEGDKWVNLDGELKAFDKPFLVFYEPAFASQKGNMEVPYSPTTIRVVDGNTKGWFKVQTWEGDKWMYPGVAETVVLDKSFYSYNEPSLIATKGAGGNQFGPQKFLPILEKRPDGWWKVVTYEGPTWIAPDGIKMPVNANFTTFDEPYLEAKKSSEFGPQKNLVAYDGKKTEQGDFYLVGTYLGQKWMSLNAEKEFNEKREPLRQALGYNENDIGPDKTPQQRVAEARAALKAQGLDDTYEAVRIPTEEEKAEFLRKEAEKQKNPKQGVARAGTVTSSWNIPDDWVQKGDIVITPDSNYGVTGHSGIIGKDFTETQGFSGANKGEYLLVHAPGTSASPAIKIMPLSKWEFIHKGNQEYSNFVYLRYKKDKGAAFRAADYAYNHFYQNGSKYRYDIFGTSAKSNDYKTYCSKLVYLSFRDGAGVDFFPVSNFYIIHPYDFLRPMPGVIGLRIHSFGKGGMWWG